MTKHIRKKFSKQNDTKETLVGTGEGGGKWPFFVMWLFLHGVSLDALAVLFSQVGVTSNFSKFLNISMMLNKSIIGLSKSTEIK